MGVVVRPVVTALERRIFLRFPWRVYRCDPLWVPPLLSVRAKALDPERGVFFQRGEAALFIAWRDGAPAATLCVAEDPPRNALLGHRDAIIGFFEYLPDYEAFEALLGHALGWAHSRGLSVLVGPFNLDYEDGYGVLTAGRDRPPTLMCAHTPPYYQTFMERYGFVPARPENVALALELDHPKLERLVQVGLRLKNEKRITVRPADFSRFDDEVGHAHRLLNAALVEAGNPQPWRRDELESLLSTLRGIADPDLILFAEVAGEAVGFLPGLPNLNEALLHANGLRYPWDYLRLKRHLRVQPACLTLKAAAVLPDYWRRGVAVALLAELTERARAKGYRWADLSITSVDNPHTIRLAERLGARIYKRWQVYRWPLSDRPYEETV